MAEVKRILVAGVGYQNLRDMSVGPLLVERLRRREWPPGVQIEDLSLGAIAALHYLQLHPPFDAALFVGGESCPERTAAPGTIRRYTWSVPPGVGEDDIQAAVAEAVTGVISLPAMLLVVGHFGSLPARTRVIEIEPRDVAWGPEISPPVTKVLDAVEEMVLDEVRELAS